MIGCNGWLETEWLEGRCMNQGYLIEGVTVSGDRASIGAKKHRNRCGAKGDRKVDA